MADLILTDSLDNWFCILVLTIGSDKKHRLSWRLYYHAGDVQTSMHKACYTERANKLFTCNEIVFLDDISVSLKEYKIFSSLWEEMPHRNVTEMPPAKGFIAEIFLLFERKKRKETAMDEDVPYPNRLGELVKRAGVSYKDLAQKTHLHRYTLTRYAQGLRIIPAETRAVMAHILKCREEDLAPISSMVQFSQPDPVNLLPSEWSNMDKLRRDLLTGIFGAGVTALTAGLLHTDEWTLQLLERLNETCWQLTNANQLEIVEQILPSYLPKVAVLAHRSGPYQVRAANLTARTYILAAEIDKTSVAAMQAYAQQGVFYSQITSTDPNVQVDAFRQQATISLVAKQPQSALLAYQQSLSLLGNVSPLLRSRMYLGLASAYARCDQKKEALRFLGLAQDSFPSDPEHDPNSLYMYTSGSKSVLHLYEALTYNDLQMPADAWNALLCVDGLHPRIPITESARIEIINLQAVTAARLGNMEASCQYIQAGVEAADKAGYPIWRQEAADGYQEIAARWPTEKPVKQLADLFL